MVSTYFLVDTMSEERVQAEAPSVVRTDRRGRRRYTDRFKRELVALCAVPGASVSGLAIERGLNPNLVRKWMRDAGLARSQPSATRLLPVTMAEPKAALAARQSATTIEIRVADAVIAIGSQASATQIEAVVRSLR